MHRIAKFRFPMCAYQISIFKVCLPNFDFQGVLGKFRFSNCACQISIFKVCFKTKLRFSRCANQISIFKVCLPNFDFYGLLTKFDFYGLLTKFDFQGVLTKFRFSKCAYQISIFNHRSRRKSLRSNLNLNGWTRNSIGQVWVCHDDDMRDCFVLVYSMMSYCCYCVFVYLCFNVVNRAIITKGFG